MFMQIESANGSLFEFDVIGDAPNNPMLAVVREPSGLYGLWDRQSRIFVSRHNSREDMVRRGWIRVQDIGE